MKTFFSVKHFKTAVGVLSVCLLALACSSPRKTRTFYAMGGLPVHIITVGLNDTTLDRMADIAKNSIEQWESELSMFRADSAVNRLAKANGQPVYFSEPGWNALEIAIEAEAITNRAFNVTVGPVIRLWKQSERLGVLPEADDISRALSWTSFEQLDLDARTRSARLKPTETENTPDSGAGFVLDFGGIAKGLFAEWLNTILYEALTPAEKSGLQKLIIDLGGDMYVRCLDERYPCQVGIRNPFDANTVTLWGIVDLPFGAVVTSGTYERFFDIGGQRYCHIINPDTGMPVETDLVSVTIIDPSGAIADALATAVFVMGETEAMRLVDSRPQTEMILIRKDGTYSATTGIQKSLRIL